MKHVLNERDSYPEPVEYNIFTSLCQTFDLY